MTPDLTREYNLLILRVRLQNLVMTDSLMITIVDP